MRTIAFIALLIAAFAAQAQVYVFGMGSKTKSETVTAPATSGTDTTGLHVGVGWRFSKYIGAEVAYLGTGHFSGADGLAQWSAKGFGVAAVGTIPMSESWSLVGKLGAYRLESEFVVCCSVLTKSRLGTLTLVSTGVQYHVWDALSVQALYQQMNGSTGDLDRLRMISVGAMLQF